MSQTNVL